MKPPQAVFMDWLLSQKLKLTPQRRVILEIFIDANDHVTPDSLFKRVQEIDSGIGIATVYRTLKLLTASGIAREMLLDDGVTHYELQHGKKHHDHIICTECSCHVEFVDQDIERLQTILAERHKFTLTDHKMILYGICPQCQEKLESKKLNQ